MAKRAKTPPKKEGPTKREILAAAIDACRDKNGKITPRAVVEAARNPKSILHREFGRLWDPRYAQQKALEDRARELISYVTVVVVHRKIRLEAPMYVRHPKADPKQQGYITLTSPEMDRENAEKIIDTELQRCQGCIERARNIAGILGIEYADLPEQLEGLLDGIIAARSRFKGKSIPRDDDQPGVYA